MRATLRRALFSSLLQLAACAGEDDSEGLSDETPCRWRIESEDGKSLARSSGQCELMASGIDSLSILAKAGSVNEAPRGVPSAELVWLVVPTELHTEPWSFEVRGSENPDNHVFVVGAQQYDEAGLATRGWLCNAANSPPVRLQVRFTEIDRRVEKSRIRGVVDAVCAADTPDAPPLSGVPPVPAVRIHVAFDFKNIRLL
jgi:hypothetical protein